RPLPHPGRPRGRFGGHEPDRRAHDRRHADRPPALDAGDPRGLPAPETPTFPFHRFNPRRLPMNHLTLTAVASAALLAACGQPAEKAVAPPAEPASEASMAAMPP